MKSTTPLRCFGADRDRLAAQLGIIVFSRDDQRRHVEAVDAGGVAAGDLGLLVNAPLIVEEAETSERGH
jgi:hypothetical protein